MSEENVSCKVNPNKFCYICGKFCFKKRQLFEFNKEYKDLYEKYFGSIVHQHDGEWSPSLFCSTCKINLSKWKSGKGGMPFATPMQWKKPRNHRNDCYFCLTILPQNVTVFTKDQIVYPTNVTSVETPKPHDESKPIPNPPGGASNKILNTSSSSTTTTTTTSGSSGDPRYKQPFNQSELNDLIRDLNLNKDQSELLASRLKQRGFVDEKTKVTFYRNRNESLIPFFKKDGELSYCDNVVGLFNEMKQPYKTDEWRLFIDSSKNSLIAALIHIGNEKPSVPIG